MKFVTRNSPFPFVPSPKAKIFNFLGFPGGSDGKEPTCQCRRYRRPRFDPWVRKIPWRRKWQPPALLLSGESHGQSSLVGYSSRGRKESNMTEQWTLSRFQLFSLLFWYLSSNMELVAPSWIFSFRHYLLVSSCRWQWCSSVAFLQRPPRPHFLFSQETEMVLVRSPWNEHVHIMFEPGSPALQADSLPTELSGKPWSQHEHC